MLTEMKEASSLRRHKWDPRTLISKGSPQGARRMNSKGVPGSRPNS